MPHRFHLHRDITPESKPAHARACCFVMLNPATADANRNDPTIRRCMGFAARENCTELSVVNLYSLRAVKPPDLLAAPTRARYRKKNLNVCAEAMANAELIICAWGVHAEAPRVAEFMAKAKEMGVKLHCLGTTKHGAPRHPLYLRLNAPLLPYCAARV
ncbi:MAG: DUF1643 domain-containing protein [Pseudomonadales bacterium]